MITGGGGQSRSAGAFNMGIGKLAAICVLVALACGGCAKRNMTVNRANDAQVQIYQKAGGIGVETGNFTSPWGRGLFAVPWSKDRMAITDMRFVPVSWVKPEARDARGLELVGETRIEGERICIDSRNTLDVPFDYEVEAFWIEGNEQHPNVGKKGVVTRTQFSAHPGDGSPAKICLRIPNLEGEYKFLGVIRPYEAGRFAGRK